MLRTTHSFIAGNDSAECSTITTMQRRKIPDRVLGHYGINCLLTKDGRRTIRIGPAHSANTMPSYPTRGLDIYCLGQLLASSADIFCNAFSIPRRLRDPLSQTIPKSKGIKRVKIRSATWEATTGCAPILKMQVLVGEGEDAARTLIANGPSNL